MMKSFLRVLFLSTVVLAFTAQTVWAEPEVTVDDEEYLQTGGFSNKNPAQTKFFLFGYGEMHYNNEIGGDDEIDFHRFVLGVGYDFSDKIRLRAEVEMEHGFSEHYLEYAYLDFDVIRQFNIRAGAILLPIGYLNQNHEPALFNGVERPEIYNRIIPTSWMEAGAGFFGEVTEGLTYQLYVHSSLDFNQGFMGATGFNGGSGLRGGRGKVAETAMNSIAASGRLQYTGIKGLRLGLSGFMGESNQGDERVRGGMISIAAADAKYSYEGFAIEGLFASVFVSDAAQINAAQLADGNISSNTAGIGSRLMGYMVEGSYNLFHHLWEDSTYELIAFVRYEFTDTQNKMPEGFLKDLANERSNISFGLTFKPLANVAVKADYIIRDNGTAEGRNDQWNLGIAYHF